MAEGPLLTVTILTYNRSPYLKALLENIAQQIVADGLEDTIAVHVNDNCSTDDTGKMVQEFCRRHEKMRVTYACNATNVGPSRNVDLAARASKTPWTWLFGDDDLFTDGALKFVVEKILSLPSDISFMTIKTDIYDQQLKEIVMTDFGGRIGGDRIFSGVDSASARFYECYGFLGSHIYRTERWIATPNMEKYIESQIPHLYFMLYWVGRGEKIAFFDRTCIKYRYNNSLQAEDDVYKIFWGLLHDRPLMIEDTITDQTARRELLKASFYTRKFTILSFKKSERGGWLPSKRTWELFNEARTHFGFIPAFWLVTPPQALIPPPIVRLLKRAYDKARVLKQKMRKPRA